MTNVILEHAQACKQMRDTLISERAKAEAGFNNWKKGVLACSEKFRNRIPFDVANTTVQTLIPEWYAEEPNEEIAKQQFERANALMQQVDEIVLALINEGKALRAEFQGMQVFLWL